MHEVAVEGTRDGSGRVLEEADPPGQGVVSGGHEPSHHVAVSPEVLGGGVHDHVRAEVEG